MLYYLFDYLEQSFNIPGAGVFQYISFRAALASIISLFITAVYGGKLIEYLRRKQVGETIRDLGLDGQMAKKGTPTMGGLIIIAAILVPTLLLAKLDNVYIILMLFTTVWLGLIGFLDDYIKVFRKRKEGLSGRFKVIGQVVLGVVVGTTMMFNDNIKIREKSPSDVSVQVESVVSQDSEIDIIENKFVEESKQSTKTTIPFVKSNEFDYVSLINWIGGDAINYVWLLFIPIVIFIVTAVSNGANLTDGMDGLAAGVSSVIGGVLALLAWVSGNIIFADYLNIMYIPNSGELVVFIAAFVGSCIGFLWYNSYPAQVFMGDTGSLTIGGIIAVFAILIRKELLLPILCGVFFIESVSVIMQVSYFKYTKRKYGEGRRIFLMSPLHHHFQKKQIPEAKIVARFLIIAVLLGLTTIVTLKLR